MHPEHAQLPDPDPLEAGLRAAFRRASKDRPSVLTAVARLTGSSPKVTLRDALPDVAPLLDPSSPDRHSRPMGRTGYQLLGEIARGGMGVILRGHDEDLGRDVAMKVLHEKLANRPELVQRFVEEAQIGGQLQHPGIVPVYELGLMADQRPYFTMKLVKGRTLAALLAERSEDADRRRLLDVFEAVCQTMAYAHSRGVIHRDLKPANVMVGAFGEVQVVDWGLAKVLRRGGVDDEKRSRAQATAISIIETVRSAPGSAGSQSVVGSVLGTPAYMPPEQARGDVEHLDERSDVFSLGAILCEILTGQPPYVGESEQTIILAAQGKLEDATARIDACGADAELIALCRQCLMPAPLARPRSAEVLAEKLHDYVTSVETRAQTARVEAAEAKVQAFAERKARRLTLSLAAAVLAFVLLGGGGFWWLAQRESEQRRTTEQSVTAALSEATLARGKQDWPAAHAALDRIQARLDAGNASAELRGQVTATRAGIEREAGLAAEAERLQTNNLALLAALENVRQPEGDRYYPTDWAKLDAQYRAIFAARSIDVDANATAVITTAFASGGIAVEIAAALDEWALVRTRAKDGAGAARLSALASALDADPFRAELRTAFMAKDTSALQRLAASDAVKTLPAPTLQLLARGLVEGGAYAQAASVLEAGRLRFPRDYSLAIGLGRLLVRDLPVRAAEGVAHYSAALALRPDNVEAWHELGRALDDYVHEHPRAVELFRMATARWPLDAHLHLRLGRALEHLGHQDEAVESFRCSIRLDPNKALAHAGLGMSLSKQGDLAGAIASYRHALEIDPDETHALTNLALALLQPGHLDEAIACCRRALAIDPKIVEAHVNWALALLNQGHPDEAIEHCHSALALDSKMVAAHTALGHALTDQREFTLAIASYQRALEIDPKYVEAHANLGLAFMGQGREDEAMASYRRALEIDPKCVDAHNNLGNALFKRGQMEEAIASYRRAVAFAPKNVAFLNNLGYALFRNKDYESAVATLRRALALDLKNVAVHGNLGAALMKLERLDEAIACFQELILLAPDDARPHYNIGVALAKQQHLEDAVASFQRALQLDPKHVDAEGNLGDALHDLGRVTEAIACYRRAVALVPDRASSHEVLGQALANHGEREEAMGCFRRAAALGMQNPQTLNDAAWWLAARPDFAASEAPEAVRYARRATELSPFTATFWNTLGVALCRAGDWQAAVGALDRSLELSKGGNVEDWLFLAIAHQHLEHFDTAKGWYQHAIEWWGKQTEVTAEQQRFRAEAELVLGIKPETKHD